MAEVCAAAALPRAQFPVHWDRGFDVLLQHLANLKSVQVNLKLRCAAHLAAGERFYPEDMKTDRGRDFRIAEVLREKLMAALDREVPYGLAVEVDAVEGGEAVGPRGDGDRAVGAAVLSGDEQRG